MDDELKNYIERHRNWQNLALNQFSFTNNLLLTISIGFIAFLFEKGRRKAITGNMKDILNTIVINTKLIHLKTNLCKID